MKINNLKENPEWKNLPCSKSENCFHCKCKKQFDSIPREDFIVKEFDLDGNYIGDKVISEITLYTKDKDEVIGWSF